MASNSGGLRRRGGAEAVKEDHVSTEGGDHDTWDQILMQVTLTIREFFGK